MVSWPEKIDGPVTFLKALGIKVGSVAWEHHRDQLQAIMAMLDRWKQLASASKKVIASLHGQLSFVAWVIEPGADQIFPIRLFRRCSWLIGWSTFNP